MAEQGIKLCKNCLYCYSDDMRVWRCGRSAYRKFDFVTGFEFRVGPECQKEREGITTNDYYCGPKAIHFTPSEGTGDVKAGAGE